MITPARKQGFIEYSRAELYSQLNLNREIVWEVYWNFMHSENGEIEAHDNICIVPTAANWANNEDDGSAFGEVPIFIWLQDQQKLKIAAEMKFYLDFDNEVDPEARMRLQVKPKFTEAVLRAIAIEVDKARSS